MSDNYTLISEILPGRLYLSSLYGTEKVAEIKGLKIDIIVSIMHYNPEFSKRPGYEEIQCIYYKCQDEDDEPIEQYFDSFHRLMNDNPEKIILVHCLYGASRSSSLIVSYLIHLKPKRNEVDKIFNFMRKRRPCVFPNSGFVNKLNIYRINIIAEQELRLKLRESRLIKKLENQSIY